MNIRVAIFEDNKLVRDALEAILNGTPGYTCCGAYADAQSLSSRIKSSNPDVVLMDIEMPGMNGIDATRIIAKEFPDVRVLIQTVFNDNEKIFQAGVGASGYVLKNDPLPNRLVDSRGI
jgi:DNA-binding NarL/FixJ family response regulator